MRLTSRGFDPSVEAVGARRRQDQNPRASFLTLPCGSDPSASAVRARGGQGSDDRIGEDSRRASQSADPILPRAQETSRLRPNRRCMTSRQHLPGPSGVRGGWQAGLRLNSPSRSRSGVADWQASVFFGFSSRPRRIAKRSVAERDEGGFTSAANRTRQRGRRGPQPAVPDCSGRDSWDN